MNGATEATLAELLAVAQTMSANIVKLNNMFSQFQSGGGSGGGGSAGTTSFVKALNPATLALNVLKGAVSAVGSVLGVMADIVGHVISGMAKTASNLIAFSLQAALGTAKLSDFYEALRDVPLVGGLFSLFGKIVGMQEKILDSYQSVSKSGAGFSGNLMDLQRAAARSYMSIESFSKVILENGPMFAGAAGGMQAGVKKFVDTQNMLMNPQGSFAKSILGLGYTAEETASALASTIKSQGVMGKQGASTQRELAAATQEYMVYLDGLAKATGQRRDQIQAEIEETEADQAFQLFLDSLSPAEAAKARDYIAQQAAVGGKAGKEVAMNAVRGIDVPLNDLQTQFFMANQNISQQNRLAREGMRDGNMDREKFRRATGEANMKSLEASYAQFKQMDEATQAIFLQANPAMAAYVASMRVAKTANFDYDKQQKIIADAQKEQQRGTAGNLAAAQKSIMGFGSAILDLIAIVLNPLIKILTSWTGEIQNSGEAIAKKFKPAVEEFAKWMTEVAWPAIKEFGRGVIKLVKDVMDAEPGKKLETLFAGLRKGAENIWKEIGPPITKAFNEIVTALKPLILDAFTGLLDLMWGGFKQWLFGPAVDMKKAAEDGQKAKDKRVDVKRDDAYWKNKAVEQLAQGKDAKLVTNSQIEELAKRLKNEAAGEAVEPTNPAKPVEGKARGGMIKPGTYLVGEKGPELITTGASGDVITNENLQALLKSQGSNNSVPALEQLNSLVAQLLRAQLQNNEYARKNAEATGALTGNLFV
jgi:hypothetical protein